MGLFGKKKAETETPAPENMEEQVTETPNLNDFDYDPEVDDAEDSGDGYDGLKGEEVIKALHKSDRIEQNLLGAVGNVADNLSRISLENVSEAYTEIKYGIRAKVIVFFGAGGGVGTSTMLLEVASRVAKVKKRVLIIDLNVMCGICELLAHSNIKGTKDDLFTLFNGTSELSNTLARTSYPNIATLGFRNRGLDSVTIIDSAVYGKSYDNLLAEVRGGYDFVFVDAGSDINYYLANNALYRADAGYIVTDGGLSSIQKLGALRSNFRYCGILSSSYGVIANKNTRNISSIVGDLGYRFVGEVPHLISIKNAGLQGKLLGADFIYAEAGGVAGAQETLGKIAEEILTPVVPPLGASDMKQDMPFDVERKEEEEASNEN